MATMKTAAVIGGGTMGADIAATFARAGCATHLVEPAQATRRKLPAHLAQSLKELAAPPEASGRITLHAGLDGVPWPAVDLVIEAIPEKLEPKQALFAELVARCRPDAILASNSSAIPIGEIGAGLPTRERMFGAHYFMPAHRVPCVEVVLSSASNPSLGEALCEFMRSTGKIPVKVKKDIPGFLANRLQHALCREAYSLIAAGIVTPEDVDAAVRFSFGFRFIAVGPMLQRDHAGLDVHVAAAAKMYPDLAADKEPPAFLLDHVRAGHLGIKAGRGLFEWTPESIAAEKARYDRLLDGALKLIANEIPPVRTD